MDANDLATKNAGIVAEYLELNAEFKKFGMELLVDTWAKPSDKGHKHSFFLNLGNNTSTSVRTLSEAWKFVEGMKFATNLITQKIENSASS